MPQENEKEAGTEEEKTTEEVKTGKTAGTMNMLDLPPEIQRRILACLSNETLSESVRPVCRAWDKEALSIIGDVYLRFVRRFNAAEMRHSYAYDRGKLRSFLKLEETLRQHFVPLMKSGLPCLVPGQILDDIIRAYDKQYDPAPTQYDMRYQTEKMKEACCKGPFQCYFKRLVSLPSEAPLGLQDLPLPVPLHHSFLYNVPPSFPYDAAVEIARLRNEAHRYRRRAEEGKEREEALLRAIAQKAGKDEEWERLLTQNQKALHLSRAQEAEEERARLWDQDQKALAHLQAEMTKERERFGDLFDQGVYQDRLIGEERAQLDHENAILRMEVERFKTLVHQAELTPPQIQAEKKCDTLRDLVAEAERLLSLLRSQADKWYLGPADLWRWGPERRRRLRRENVSALFQIRAEKMEEEGARLRALLARQPEHEEALLPGEQGQGRLQDGGQDEALPHPHLPPLSTYTKDPIPH